MFASNGKSITISAYNRPDYFARVMEGLACCEGVEEYQVTAVLDPSDKTEELAKIAGGHGVRILIPERHMGCGAAIRFCIELGFHQSDFHIHLEDDTVPSPDCLRWFEWAQRNAPAKTLTISAYHRDGIGSRSNEAGYREWFTPWGWGTWRRIYMGHLRGVWKDRGWDNQVQDVRIRLGWGEIYPQLSRIQNIGAERGTFCPGPEFHRTHQHAHAVTGPEDSQESWVLTQAILHAKY